MDNLNIKFFTQIANLIFRHVFCVLVSAKGCEHSLTFGPPVNMFPICCLIAAIVQQVISAYGVTVCFPAGVNPAVRIHLNCTAAVDTRNVFTF